MPEMDALGDGASSDALPGGPATDQNVKPIGKPGKLAKLPARVTRDFIDHPNNYTYSQHHVNQPKRRPLPTVHHLRPKVQVSPELDP